jgi:hypothetical protein
LSDFFLYFPKFKLFFTGTFLHTLLMNISIYIFNVTIFENIKEWDFKIFKKLKVEGALAPMCTKFLSLHMPHLGKKGQLAYCCKVINSRQNKRMFGRLQNKLCQTQDFNWSVHTCTNLTHSAVCYNPCRCFAECMLIRPIEGIDITSGPNLNDDPMAAKGGALPLGGYNIFCNWKLFIGWTNDDLPWLSIGGVMGWHDWSMRCISGKTNAMGNWSHIN